MKIKEVSRYCCWMSRSSFVVRNLPSPFHCNWEELLADFRTLKDPLALAAVRFHKCSLVQEDNHSALASKHSENLQYLKKEVFFQEYRRKEACLYNLLLETLLDTNLEELDVFNFAKSLESDCGQSYEFQHLQCLHNIHIL